MKRIFFILFIFLFSVNLRADLKLYAVEYGESKFNSRFIYYKDKQNKMLPFSWLFYVIKEDNRIILIDCGFSAKRYIKMFKIKFTDPISLLNKLNIKPHGVTDLIITHHHFDHAGNILQFPEAKIYIQKDEWRKIAKNLSLKKRKKLLKKTVLFSENYSLSEKIKIYKIGSHSPGSSIVVINNRNRKIMLLGDEFYYLDNLAKKVPSGSGNYKKNEIFLNKIVNQPYIFFTFHDPGIVKGNTHILEINIEAFPELSKNELGSMPY